MTDVYKKDDDIDRWMAADLAKGGDPTTYWSRKSAAIASGADVEEVPSIGETIMALRQRLDAAEASAKRMDSLARFFDSKMEWSVQVFGPGNSYSGIVEHIRKELNEIELKPSDLEEWIDVVLLAMDGAWRSAGASGHIFVAGILAKDEKNRKRKWPDWRTLAPGQVSEHVREVGEASTLPPPEGEV
jgi:hypothetical protein